MNILWGEHEKKWICKLWSGRTEHQMGRCVCFPTQHKPICVFHCFITFYCLAFVYNIFLHLFSTLHNLCTSVKLIVNFPCQPLSSSHTCLHSFQSILNRRWARMDELDICVVDSADSSFFIVHVLLCAIRTRMARLRFSQDSSVLINANVVYTQNMCY